MSARYSVGLRLRIFSTAETSPQIWLRWMVATVSSLSCRARSLRSSSGEHMSGAQADTPTVMRPLRAPCHFACSASVRAMHSSPSAASTSNGPGSPILPLALSQAFSHSSRRRPVSAIALRVVLDVAAVFERRRRAAADRFQRGEPHHRDHLVARELRHRQRREPAGERRLVRRREVLVDALGDDQVEMGVDVGKARHHHLAGAVDGLARRESARRSRAEGPTAAILPSCDRDCGVVMDRVVGIDRDDRGVRDDRLLRHVVMPLCARPAASHIVAPAQPGATAARGNKPRWLARPAATVARAGKIWSRCAIATRHCWDTP